MTDDELSAKGRRSEPAAPANETIDDSQILERLALTPAERLATFSASHRNLRNLTGKARAVRPDG